MPLEILKTISFLSFIFFQTFQFLYCQCQNCFSPSTINSNESGLFRCLLERGDTTPWISSGVAWACPVTGQKPIKSGIYFILLNRYGFFFLAGAACTALVKRVICRNREIRGISISMVHFIVGGGSCFSIAKIPVYLLIQC